MLQCMILSEIDGAVKMMWREINVSLQVNGHETHVVTEPRLSPLSGIGPSLWRRSRATPQGEVSLFDLLRHGRNCGKFV